ncbi:acyl carrier protein [Streptomyces sp. NPDC050658]|uniref:acyl carrier protein n=1 Tax=unclassified Streptomyces TaxID=2593676 RepID=UPI00342CC470
MTDQLSESAPLTAEGIEQGLLRHLEGKLGTSITADHDLFASGLVSSMFAMELVVHLEGTYAVAIVGPDLKLDNFRTVQRMTSLVLGLRDASAGDV